MGRKRDFDGLKFFKIDGNHAKCLLCEYTHTGKNRHVHANVLRHHMLKQHKEVELPTPKKPKTSIDQFLVSEPPPDTRISYTTTKDKVVQNVVDSIAKGGLPLWAFERPGLSDIVEPICTNAGLSLNRSAVRTLVLEAAKTKREELARLVSNRLIAIKLDLCTRCRRHFLGVNMQLVQIETKSIFTATLFVQELTGPATTKAIYEAMHHNRQRKQRYWALQLDELNSDVDEDDLCEDDDDTEANDDIEWSRAIDQLPDRGSVSGVRCGMHTFQLAVNKALKTLWIPVFCARYVQSSKNATLDLYANASWRRE
ncbi:hypothetical protein AC1031_021662 [Aphanomyces cochlioides]|nr:hypothetical protein AC1031_021662 [Aphanomyces cochlioides]